MGPRALLCCVRLALLCAAGAATLPRPPVPKDGAALEQPAASLAPTEAAPGSAASAALSFLRSGDAARLAQANCSGPFAVPVPAGGAGPPAALRAALRAPAESLAHAANFLNMLLQANDIREASLAEDAEWYHALVRGLVAAEPRARRAVLAFDAHPLAAKPRLVLQATQEGAEILLRDLSAAAAAAGRGNLSGGGGTERWIEAPEPPRGLALRKRLLRNDLRSLETPKWSRGDGYVGDAGHVRWSPPFLECRDGKFLPAWMLTLSSAFYGLKPDLSPEFKGVVRLDVALQDVPLEPCAGGAGWLGAGHRCDLNSTQESRGFVLGSYVCRCRPGFYGAHGGAAAGGGGAEAGGRVACRPCRPGCAACQDDAPCVAQEDRALRAAVLGCQAACMLAVFLSMLVSYHFRKSKRIRASGVILLETILFGSLLLYFPVFILYFKPSIFRCIVLRWVRVLGFAIVYGTVTLKLYSVLKAFLSRTAQRVPYLSSGRVLRMLALILLLVLWFLAAWTVGTLENVDRNIPLVIRSQTAGGLHFHRCGHDRWDYMMVMGELLLLLWGSSLCVATRAVPSAFHEPRYLGIALHNELLVSAAFHVARFVLVPSLHPDWTLLLFFAHAHSTVTMTLALLFLPKFLRAGSPLREEIAAEVYEDELDMRRSGSCMTSSIASAWSEHSLDPDDIRDELKKLYAQLEAQRARRMAACNPHLPRGSRRGRSVLRRSAELPRSAATPGTRRRSAARRETGGSLRLREGTRQRRRGSSLRKSRSAEEPARKSPVLAAAKASEASDSDSLEAAPLVCKSASARDLTVPTEPLRPPAPALQKSLSFGGACERAPPPAAGDKPPAPPQPPERAAPGSPRRSRRHVTYAPVKSVSVDGAPRPGRVRVAVRRTPPAPPVRHQSLAPSGDTRAAAAMPSPSAGARELLLLREETPGAERSTGGASGPAPRGASLRSLGLALRAFRCPRARGIAEQGGQGGRGGDGEEEGTGSAVQSGCITVQSGSAEQEHPGDTHGTPVAAPGSTQDDAGSTLWMPGDRPLLSPAVGGSWNRADWPRESTGTDPFAASKPKAEAAEEPEAPARPGEAAPGKGSLLRQEAIASPEDGGIPTMESPAARGAPAGMPGLHPGKTEADSGGKTDLGEKVAPKAAGAMPREAVCPWESHGTEDRPVKHDPEPSGKVGSGESRSAEVCPWEAAEAPAEAERLERDRPKVSKWVKIIRPKSLGLLRAQESGSSRSASLRPRGSGSVEVPASPEPPAAKTGTGPSPGGASAAPAEREGRSRDAEEPEPGSRVEICPWEASEAPVRKEEKKGKEKEQILAERRITRQAALVSPARSLERGGSERAAVCPWESLDTGQPPATPRAGSPGLPKPPSGTSQSTDKADICPWETQESEGSSKAEICPWESQDTAQLAAKPRAESPGLPKPSKPPSKSSQSAEKTDICPWEVQESKSDTKAEICPWESLDTAQLAAKPHAGSPGLPKPPSGTSQSVDKVDICPWETQESEGSSKAEICPWESLDMAQLAAKPRAGSPGLPKPSKPPSGTSQSTEKVDICPWEMQESEGSSKAEICPWEAAAPPADQGKAKPVPGGISKGDKRITRQAALVSPARSLERGGSERAAVCPWESLDTGQPPATPRTGSPGLPKPPSGTSQSTDKADICPWEVQESEGDIKAEICPWESQDTAQFAAKPRAGSPGLPKPSKPPSSSSQSVEKTDICPWETQESKDGTKAKICPWESVDTAPLAAKPRAGSPGLPKPPSGTSQSTDKADICPWETQESRGDTKAEICPWEAAEPPSLGEKLREAQGVPSTGSKSTSPRKSLFRQTGGRGSASKEEKESGASGSMQPQDSVGMGGSSAPGITERLKAASRKSGSAGSVKAKVCPWESQGAEEPSIKTGTGKSPRESTESSRSDVCPWEGAEPQVAELESTKADAGAARAPSSESGKPVSGAGTGHKPLCRILPSVPTGTSVAEVCPWEAEAAPAAPGQPRGPSAAAPQEAESTEPIPSRRGQDGARESPRDSGSAARTTPDICPWDHE